MAISSHGRATEMGTGPAAVAVALLAGLTAVLGGVFLRWLVGRLPWLRGVTTNRIVSVALVIVLFGVIMTMSMPLVEKLSHSAPTGLLLVNPYVGAAATLEDDAGRGIIQSTAPSGTTTPAEDLPGFIWSVLMWVYVVAALVLWLLAVHHYARKTRD
jgi:hypothetical protein